MSSGTDRWGERLGNVDRIRAATILLALVAATVSLLSTTELFPYRSLNHDEGVYLQQAELLRAGLLYFQPPVADAFRPWFFVESEPGLYAKYAPIPAAVFALGRLLGGYPLALASISAVVVGLTASLGRELFGDRTGLLAGGLVLASPLFLIHSGVYLPYALTTALNLAFALAYLRAERTGSRRAAAVAGGAVGLAFFARPYTALLFALPFVVHACVTLARSGAWRVLFGRLGGDGGLTVSQRGLFTRRLLTAGLGTAGVAVALGYNSLVTGDPLVFPYQAFAPEDGIGFGHRQILGHEEEYTVSLALRANARVLTQLFTEWVVAGTLGTALAAVGVALAARRRIRDAASTSAGPALLAGLFLTVPAGNVAFWGNRNVLGRLTVPDDGLIHHLGPYYHYDLLVPTAVFAAVAIVAGGRWFRVLATRRFDPGTARPLTVAMVLIMASVGGATAATTAAGPVERNAAVSEELAAAYEPFGTVNAATASVETPAETGNQPVIFLPTPYGPWLNHPFQLPRNNPDFSGAVYPLGDTRELAVAETFSDRPLYRYVMRGAWNPTDGESVVADVRPVKRAAGERIRLSAALGLPPATGSVTVRAGGDEGATYLVAEEIRDTLEMTVTIDGDRAALRGPNLSPTGSSDGSFAVATRDELVVEVFVSTGPGAGSGFSYQMVFPVARDDGAVRALSPTVERCPVPDRCVPVGLGSSPDWATAETTFETESAG